MIKQRLSKKLTFVTTVFIVVTFSLVGFFGEKTALAAPVTGFNSGEIIDDIVFTNAQSMDVSQIQNFLNSKVPVCDTWGTGGSTPTARRDYIRSYGYDTPLTCLKDYQEGGKGAAQIIYDTAQEFQINPQVLIVVLQKEQGLVTDDWPGPWQYKTATGYGCPDTAACDSQYFGLTNQIRWTARMFRAIMNNSPTWYTPYVLGNNYVLYNPNSSCGGSVINILNRATQALYNYTPYQPNQSALDAGYGMGDGCGAYGNRNFYLYFTDWFGSTKAGIAVSSALSVSSGSSAEFFSKIPTTVSFYVTNNSNNSVDIGAMAVAVRDSQGNNLDYPLKSMVVPAYTTVKYESSQILPRGDLYSFEIVNYSSGSWRYDYPASSITVNPRKWTIKVLDMPTLVSGVTLSDELRNGKDTTATFSYKNNSSEELNLGKISLGVRGPNGENLDLADNAGALSAGQIYTFSKTFRPPKDGTYRFFITATLNDGTTWESNYPMSDNNTIKQEITAESRPGQTISGGVQSQDAVLRIGKTTNLSFTVKNYASSAVSLGKIGLAGRDPLGGNVDPGVQAVTLAAGEEKTLTFPTTPTKYGNYNYYVISTINNGTTWSNGPPVEQVSIGKNLSLPSRAAVTVIGGVNLASANLHANEATTISYTIKNYGSTTVDLGKIGLYGRDPSGRNVDPVAQLVTLAPGETRVLVFATNPITTGVYSYGIIQTSNSGVTWTSGPDIESAGIQKETSIVVKPSVVVTTNLAITPTSLKVGQATTISYTIKNYGSTTVDLGKIGLYGRDPSGRNVDPVAQAVTLAAGEEKVLQYVVTPSQVGMYEYGILETLDNGVTWSNGPASDQDAIIRKLKLTSS